ncbi:MULTISPECIES: TerD family protein [unclassified Fusibacter]|uniref:TerD family protein n=1 Tax=unclassified Fusibacter TaxID=2624464 RepID=UPI0010132403|nr:MULTISPECIES: TerD family protein [unclassified Fusibacter]MCK8058238.1 TerD family protein [Fusibacter sp. A2]NPE20821.1 TerD family protein [Fusibacter sp. A1]RXV63025.1 TerD family protein [Fusibacter sp. A1]
MAVNLTKGQKVDLTKGNPGMDKVVVGLGWDTNKYDGAQDFDLDSAAFLTNAQGKVVADSDFIFFNNLVHPSQAVKHLGDNLTGEGEGDDEQLVVTLSKVPAEYEKISFTVTIHDAEARGQNFGQISNAFIRIVNEATNEELIRYDLSEDYSIETAVVVAELYKHNGEWKFAAIGAGFEGGLASLCQNFGINV